MSEQTTPTERLEKYELCPHHVPASQITSRRCAQCQKEIDEEFESFWRSIVTTNGALDEEKVKAELSDFSTAMREVGKVYCEITGDATSKILVPSETILQLARAHQEEQAAYDAEDDEEEAAAEAPTLEEAQACVAKMSYSEVKAVLRSHRAELWLDNEPIVRKVLEDKIVAGVIADPTRSDDTVMRI